VHVVRFGDVVKCPLAHGTHVRSLLNVFATVSYWPGVQTVMAVHTRSDDPVGAVDSNSVAVHSVRGEQTRSEETVCAALSHSVERGSTTPL
jgi:hypothetical protein